MPPKDKTTIIHRVTTKQTLLYGFGALFLLFILMGVFNVQHMLGMRAEMGVLAQTSMLKGELALHLSSLVNAQNQKMADAAVRALAEAIDRHKERFAELAMSPAERLILDQESLLAGEVLAAYTSADAPVQLETNLVLDPEYLSSGFELFDHVLRPTQQARLDLIRQLQRLQETEIHSGVAKIQDREERDHYLQLGLGVLLLLGGSAIVFLISRRVVLTEKSLLIEKEHAVATLNSLAEAVIATDAQNRVTRLNPAAERLLGVRAEAALGSPLAAVLETVMTDGRSLHDIIPELISGDCEVFRSDDLTLITGAGSFCDLSASVTGIKDGNGLVVGTIIALQDVTEAKATSRVLERQAHYDQLTGLLNRYAFEEQVARCLDATPLSAHTLCIIDLDQFKLVNDTCGHAAGDEMLRRIAEWLKNAVRKDDVLARMGGDEFAVLLTDCAPEHAQKVSEGILDRIRQFRFDWEDKLFTLSASIGGVGVGKDLGDFSQWLRTADTACFMAKDLGRDRSYIHRNGDEDVPQRHAEMDWVRRIRDALENDRFCLYAQKIAPLHRGEADHWELLVRMRGEDGELVPPMAFIPAAERYNLMPMLDRWVVDSAFSLIAQAAAPAGDEVYSINLSGRSLGEESFTRFVLERVAHYNIDLAKICFEITETAAIADVNHATVFMAALREKRCRFALDDFGNGLSSFGYLKDLPIDYLKIDGQFVRGLGRDPVCHSIVEAISKIAHATDLKTVAEFVDSETTVMTLRTLGVDFVQGYYIGEPVPVETILASASGRQVA